MISIRKNPDTSEKLHILSNDSKYDLACACATNPEEHRKRSKEDKWIYPVTLPNGSTTFLYKTLLSNACANDCKYCPLRSGTDTNRCSLSPEELAKSFLQYYRARKVHGLFLSSAVVKDADTTMERINRTARILRRMNFKGYIHLKVIPGASQTAILETLSLASAVSLNIETAGEENFKRLSIKKDYRRDILGAIEFMSRLTAKNPRFKRVKQTTQFVVGASQETDRDIIRYTGKLYKDLNLNRVYFSAYQRGAGARDLPGEHSRATNNDLLTREHRLYQTDWLLRKYGFAYDEIPLEADGSLSLTTDPKEMWARMHPEYFPVNVNKDTKEKLLRVPGLGHITVEKILQLRKEGIKMRSFKKLGRPTKLLEKAQGYVVF
jgi:predicted DNA-binding helix-hairpin-helix protein